MQFDGKHLRVAREVLVRGQNREPMPFGYGTDQEVGVGALEPTRATRVEALSRAFEILRRDRLVWERTQVISELFEPGRLADSSQDLLPNRTHDGGTTVGDQATQLVDGRVTWRPAPERQRPDRCVDEYLHRRRRCFL